MNPTINRCKLLMINKILSTNFSFKVTSLKHSSFYYISYFLQRTPAHCTALPTQHVQPSGFTSRGPMIWNSLPEKLRDLACDIDSFILFFKIIQFSQY